MYSTSASASAAMSAFPSALVSESVTMGSPSIQGNEYPDHMGNAMPPTVGSVDSDQFPYPVEGISCAHKNVYVHVKVIFCF